MQSFNTKYFNFFLFHLRRLEGEWNKDLYLEEAIPDDSFNHSFKSAVTNENDDIHSLILSILTLLLYNDSILKIRPVGQK